MDRSGGKQRTLRLVICALFTALTAVCGPISIPTGGQVPFSLGLFAVLLTGTMLPVRESLMVMAAYLLLGLAGVPVFTGFRGGLSVLVGPTGGYLIGYLPCVLAAGLIIRRFGRSAPAQAVALTVGVLVCYAFGTAWFMYQSGRTFAESLSLCVLPFLPFDAIKIALSVTLSRRLYPRLP